MGDIVSIGKLPVLIAVPFEEMSVDEAAEMGYVAGYMWGITKEDRNHYGQEAMQKACDNGRLEFRKWRDSFVD